jgi:hypothetical protein
VSFLQCATQAPRELFDLLAACSQKTLTAESLVTVPPSSKATASQWLALPWNCFDLISTLIKLAEIEEEDDAKQLLDFASRQATELVLLGLCQVKVSVVLAVVIKIIYKCSNRGAHCMLKWCQN